MPSQPGSPLAVPSPGAAARARAAVAVCRRPANLRRTIRIALVVGSVLTAINQADVILDGRASALTAVKIPLNFLVPFVVSNLGVLAGTRAAAERAHA